MTDEKQKGIEVDTETFYLSLNSAMGRFFPLVCLAGGVTLLVVFVAGGNEPLLRLIEAIFTFTTGTFIPVLFMLTGFLGLLVVAAYGIEAIKNRFTAQARRKKRAAYDAHYDEAIERLTDEQTPATALDEIAYYEPVSGANVVSL